MVLLCPLIAEDQAYSYVASIIDGYSQESLLKLQRKKTIPTNSESLNSLFSGGIKTQEIVEVVGLDHLVLGDFLTYITIDHLCNNQNSEAIIISTNGFPNEYQLYELCCDFLKKDDCINESILDILRRIYIINCLSDTHLSNILDDVLEGRYSTRSSPEPLNVRDGCLNTLDKQCLDSRDQHLTIVQIQSFSSLFDNSDAQSTKYSSALLAIKLRNLCNNLNCSILVSNFQTALSLSSSLSYDPYVELDNPAFSKLSQKWHSCVDIKIYIKPLNKREEVTMISAKIIKSKREKPGRTCYITL